MTQQLDRAWSWSWAWAGPAAGPRRFLAGPWAPAVPAAVTLLVAGFQLGRAPLWRDELATWSAATRPLPDLWRMLAEIDAVTGPYYLFMHGWIALFGDSAVALRLPSLLAMAGTAALTARLGTRLFGPATGLLAGLLFAVAPSTSRYGQEARGYAFAALFAVLATLLLIRAVDGPTRWRLTAYAAALLALGLCNVVALLVVAGHAAAVLGRRRAALAFLAAVAAVAVLLTPLILAGRGQQGVQLGWVPRPGAGELLGLPGSVLQAGAVGGALLVLAALGWATAAPTTGAAASRKATAGPTTGAAASRRATAGPTTGAAASRKATAGPTTGAAASRRATVGGATGGGRWPTVLALSVLLPAALLFAAGLVAPFWVPRYLLFTVAFLCVLAAAGLRRIRPSYALALVVVIAALGAPAQAGLRRSHEWPRSAPVDYPAAVAVIRANARPGDGIVYEPRAGWKMLDVAVAYGLGGAAPRDVLVAQTAVARGELRPTECADPAACLSRAGSERIWLLAAGNRPDPLAAVPGAKGAALRAGYRITQVWREPGLSVALLTRR